MELISQHAKRIMEGCKERARDAGLRFENESLEYIVTNRDLLELSPKLMIPTLYDYWVHDVEVLKEKGRYELYPTNPFETVINTRPAISYYNDNNPDWLNVMIFYHVLGHIDFFQNNHCFRHTWDYDLTGQALADKRLIAKLRSERGRWVDYVIEFARGIDNLVAYHRELSDRFAAPTLEHSQRLDFYFDVFLQSIRKVRTSDYIAEIERYNECVRQFGKKTGEQSFFNDLRVNHPEFEAVFERHRARRPKPQADLLQFLMNESEFLNREQNKWMLSILQIVRKTSLYFQPQIRTKIMNEGWASYWHDKLFLKDDRIRGHEVDYARIHASVTSLPRVGLNPYALGMRMFQYLEESADKGRHSYDFQRLSDAAQRRDFDQGTGRGQEFIFGVREDHNDFTFVNTFLDQDFVERHRLFVSEKRLNRSRMTWQYSVKSRKADDYREMVLGSLFHPPHIEVDAEKSSDGGLYLNHLFEGKPLVREYIANTMLGVEYLWGGPVKLETTEVASASPGHGGEGLAGAAKKQQVKWRRVVYTMENRKLSSRAL